MNYKYIYTLCLSLSFLLVSNFVNAQGTNCAASTPFCVAIPVDYPAGTGTSAASGANYGCLGSQPNPAWFSLEVDNTGPINLSIGRNPARDIDFAIWGPFAPGTTVNDACTTIFGGGLAPTDCSFAGGVGVETPSINPTVTGQIYILLVTNFSNAQTDLILTQDSGIGNTSCDNICAVDVNDDVTTCGVDGTTTTLSASNVAGWTYQWYRDGVLIVGATNSTYDAPTPSVGATVTNTYRVEATNPSQGCTNTAEVDVTINVPSFTVNLGADISRCDAAGAVTLDAANASHGGAFTYQWSLNGTAIGGATNSTLSVNFTSTGGNPVTRTYSVVTTDPSVGGCSISDAVDVTFIPDPVVNLGANIVACDGTGAVTLDASDASHGSTISYQWLENGVTIVGATNATYDVTFASGGASQTKTYRVNVTDSRGTGCVQFDEVDVTRNPISFTVDLGADLTRCDAAGTVTLDAANASHGAGFTYQWAEGGTDIAGATNSTYDVTFTSTGGSSVTKTYTVTVTDPAPGACAVNDAIDVTFIPDPIIDLGADIVACDAFGTITLDASDASHGATISYQWFEDGVAIAGATNATYDVSFASTQTKTYRAEVTDSRGTGCTQSDEVDVTFEPNFTVNLGADISRCDADGSVTLNAVDASHGAGFTYQWSVNGIAIAGATNSTLNVNFTSTGTNSVTRTYSVTVSAASPTQCEISDAIDVTFIPNPVVSLGADIVACDNQGTITLDADDASHGATISYQWFENGNIIAGATNATLDVSFPSGGAAQTRTYRAEVTDSRGTGCTQSDEIDVTFKPNLVVNLGQNIERCENVFQFNINASDATHSGNMTYRLFENGLLIATSTNPIFSVSINDATATTVQTRTYRVTATDNTALGCSTTSNNLSVTYNYKPIIAAIADRIDVDCVPNQLEAQISNYTTNDSRLNYSWMYSGANGVQYEASTEATVLVNTSGTYTLTVTTTLANGSTCSSVESFVLKCNDDDAPSYIPVLTGQPGYSYVDLQWTAIPEGSNITEFEVYMGINGEEPNTLVTLTSDNFLKVDVINGFKYSFRIRAVYLTQGGNNYEVGVYSNTVILKPSIVLGQDETDRRAAISLFPNPSNGSFTVEFKAIQAQKANLTVVDLTGKIILTKSLSDLNNGSQQNIQLGRVASGMYIVQVQTEKGVYQQKIMIAK